MFHHHLQTGHGTDNDKSIEVGSSHKLDMDKGTKTQPFNSLFELTNDMKHFDFIAQYYTHPQECQIAHWLQLNIERTWHENDDSLLRLLEISETLSVSYLQLKNKTIKKSHTKQTLTL